MKLNVKILLESSGLVQGTVAESGVYCSELWDCINGGICWIDGRS